MEGKAEQIAVGCHCDECVSPHEPLRASHVEFPQVGAGQGAQDRGRGQWGVQAVCFHLRLSSSVRTFLMSSGGTLVAFQGVFLCY